MTYSAEVAHAAWTRNANLYCINVRQFTAEGTFSAAQTHLERLKAMGVSCIWLLPIHPIGVTERKGSLGSYYAASDYTAINPEFGTLADFKQFVSACHRLEMKLIIDWVANHTAWDHVWVKQHFDWYKHNDKGEIFPVTFTGGEQVEYWTDVIALDFEQPALWSGMIDAMKYWVTETNIDGFRCDVAGMVPVPFWQQARRELDVIKPMFMLAEWHTPQMHDQAFDMTYDTQLFDIFKQIAKGQAGVAALQAWWQTTVAEFNADDYRMTYTANHDTNSWQGSDQELFGPALNALSVLAATLPGMPLIYGGQETGFCKRLEFFEKDPIVWKQYERSDFYRTLLKLKAHHPALANGNQGGSMVFEETSNPQVVRFRREKPGHSGLVWIKVTVNLSAQAQVLADNTSLDAWQWQIEQSE
jgi:glycosidase